MTIIPTVYYVVMAGVLTLIAIYVGISDPMMLAVAVKG